MTQSTPNPGADRGSALLLVTVLLGVLAVVGAAAVSLGSQERINAAAKGKRDMMAACADAARMLIWAEAAKYGSSRLQDALQEQQITLRDGTVLSAPSHYAASTDIQSVKVDRFTTPNPAMAGDAVACTNEYCRDASISSAWAYNFVARCRDAAGRQIEVEFSTQILF